MLHFSGYVVGELSTSAGPKWDDRSFYIAPRSAISSLAARQITLAARIKKYMSHPIRQSSYSFQSVCNVTLIPRVYDQALSGITFRIQNEA
jgi:hypothetical protein